MSVTFYGKLPVGSDSQDKQGDNTLRAEFRHKVETLTKHLPKQGVATTTLTVLHGMCVLEYSLP